MINQKGDLLLTVLINMGSTTERKKPGESSESLVRQQAYQSNKAHLLIHTVTV